MALLEFLPTAARARIIATKLRFRARDRHSNGLPIDVKPLVAVFSESAPLVVRLVDLFFLIWNLSAEFRDKLNDAFMIRWTARLGFLDVKAKPCRVFRPGFCRIAIEVVARLWSVGALNVIDRLLGVCAITRTHQGFGGRRVLLAFNIGPAAIAVIFLGIARTKVHSA